MLINGLNSTILQTILDGINTLLSGEQGIETVSSTRVEVDKTYAQLVRVLLDSVEVPSARIDAGTYTLKRIRSGVTTTIASGVASSKTTGHVLASITYSDADWNVGDVFQLVFTGIKILALDEVSVLEELPDVSIYGQIVEVADVSTDVTTIRTAVEHADYGLETIKEETTGVGLTVQALEHTLNDPGVGKLWIVDDKINDLLTDTAITVNALQHGTYGLAALLTAIQTVDTQTDILANGTHGLAALKTLIDTANTALAQRLVRHGTVLINNPSWDAVNNWMNNAGYSIARETGVYRSSPASLKVTLTQDQLGTTGTYTTASGKAKRYGRYYGSVWVYSSVANLQVRAAIYSSSYTNNRYFGSTVILAANTWTKIEGIATLDNAADAGDLAVRVGTANGLNGDVFYIDDLVLVELDSTFDDWAFQTLQSAISSLQTTATNTYNIVNSGTYGNSALKTALDGKATPADVLSRLNLAIDGTNPPTAKSLRDILNKNSSYTYDKAKHSVEAIGDDTDSIIAYVKAGRSANSGSVTMTGSEQTLYEESHTADWEFKGGWIDLRNLADTRSVTIKVYIKMESGGSYIEVASTTFTGSADAKVYPCPASFPIGGSSVKVVLPSWWNRYGVKVTAQQTVLGGGYIAVKHEWFDGKS